MLALTTNFKGDYLRFLPTMIHNVLDYLVALLVIVLRFVLGGAISNFTAGLAQMLAERASA